MKTHITGVIPGFERKTDAIYSHALAVLKRVETLCRMHMKFVAGRGNQRPDLLDQTGKHN
ncbi:hypothetical protein SDC9_199292 [bioreactor metagenome]|uniref:Uncharacterized protein n=1 Tax=bioreactor metagenome TaxID=1076179 RepID=A0A645IWS5_9ZZZZ